MARCIENKPIRSSGDIPALVAEMKPGTKVNVTAIRKDKEESFHVTIGSQPKDWGTKKAEE